MSVCSSDFVIRISVVILLTIGDSNLHLLYFGLDDYKPNRVQMQEDVCGGINKLNIHPSNKQHIACSGLDICLIQTKSRCAVGAYSTLENIK